MCLSFSIGSLAAYLFKKYEQRNKIDPLVTELKARSPIITVSLNGEPLKPPLVRGGSNYVHVDKKKLLGWSLVIKNKRLAVLIKAIGEARRNQKLLASLRRASAILNAGLATTGLRITVGRSVDFT